MSRYVEKFIYCLWFLFFFLMATHSFRSFFEATVIISPLLIFIFFGFDWLSAYSFKSVLFAGIVAYLLIILITQFIAVDSVNSLDALRKYHLKFISIFISLLFVLRKRENWSFLLWGMAGTILLADVFAYYNWLAPDPYHLWEPAWGMDAFPNAVTAFGIHKNGFSTYYALFLPTLLGMLYSRLYRIEKMDYKTIGLALLIILSIPILWMTQARSGQAAVLVGIGFVILVSLKYEYFWKKSLFLIVAFILLIVAFSFTSPGQTTIKRWTSADVKKMSGRVNRIWPRVLRKTESYRWWGIDFSDASAKKVIGEREEGFLLFMFVRTGIIGFTTFVLFSLLLFIYSARNIIRRGDLETGMLLSGFVGSYIGLYFFGGVALILPFKIFNFGSLVTFIFVLNQELDKKKNGSQAG